MAPLTQVRRRKLHARFDFPIAQFLAELAARGKTITYGGLAERFGGIARGYGNKLSGIALRCHERGLPLLSVLVVSNDTGTPSVDADVYEYLGVSPEMLDAERERCFAFDWSKTPLGSQ